MPNVKNTMIDKMLSVVAPHLCSGCGKIGSTLCNHCKYDINKNPFSMCLLCERASEAGICRKHKTAYTQAWIVGERQGALQRLIGGFKFQNMKAAARSLAELLDARLPLLSADTIIVPIPTAPAHIRERGYDHTLLIARYFAQKRQLPLDHRLIGRNNTKTQHSATRNERIHQATSAFRLIGSIDEAVNYLVIDDVITTGSTIEQASQLLKKAGARNVWIGALARQPLD